MNGGFPDHGPGVEVVEAAVDARHVLARSLHHLGVPGQEVRQHVERDPGDVVSQQGPQFVYQLQALCLVELGVDGEGQVAGLLAGVGGEVLAAVGVGFGGDAVDVVEGRDGRIGVGAVGEQRHRTEVHDRQAVLEELARVVVDDLPADPERPGHLGHQGLDVLAALVPGNGVPLQHQLDALRVDPQALGVRAGPAVGGQQLLDGVHVLDVPVEV